MGELTHGGGGGGGGGLIRGVTQELRRRWAYPWRGLYAGGLIGREIRY